jgi:hypothetical protein
MNIQERNQVLRDLDTVFTTQWHGPLWKAFWREIVEKRLEEFSEEVRCLLMIQAFGVLTNEELCKAHSVAEKVLSS